MCGVRNSVPGGINIVSVRVVQFSLKIAIGHVVRVIAGEIKRETRVVVHRTNLNITGFTYNNGTQYTKTNSNTVRQRFSLNFYCPRFLIASESVYNKYNVPIVYRCRQMR